MFSQLGRYPVEKKEEIEAKEGMDDWLDERIGHEHMELENGQSSKISRVSRANQPQGGVTPSDSRISGIMHSLIAQAQACQYEFAEYFVAWQGVLTLAFSGIPPSLCQLKQNISEQLEGIVKENPGSKWPKISLGCLQDDKTLTLQQLYKLRQICSEERPSLAASAPVLVDHVSLVLFANCCLEKTISVASTPLMLPADLSRPTPEERLLVQGVLNEFALENIDSYHNFILKAGNRSGHYRCSKVGATVVHFVRCVPLAVARFRARVDSELPGMYDWFADESLHITIRALL